MAFKDEYEKYFGPASEYEPLDPKPFVDRTKRRALDIQGAAPTATPKAIFADEPMLSAPPEPEQGAITGLLKTGTGMLGEAGLGALEYGLDKAQMPFLADAVEGKREKLAAWRESVYNRMDREVIDMKGREFLTLDPDKTIWQGSPLEVGEALMYKLVEQVPMTLATLVPGGLLMRAGSKGALTYLGASEAGLSVGFIQNEIKDGIAEMSDDELRSESDRFAQLYAQYSPEEARNRFAAEATGMAPLIGGLVVGAIGATAGRYLEPVITGTGSYGAAQRFGRGFVGEGVFQEAPQESIEQLASNAARAAYDGDIELLDGVAEAAVQGLAVGGPMGGAFGVAAGRKAIPTEEDTDPTATVEDDVPAPPEEGGPGDMTFPETDLLGDKITSVPRAATRDPLAQWDDPLTLNEEYQAIDVRSYKERELDEMTQDRENRILAKPKGKRTKDEKAFLAARQAKRDVQTNLEVRYGIDPAIEAATAAAVGRMGRQSGVQRDMLEEDRRAQQELGGIVGQEVSGLQPPTSPYEVGPGGQQEIPGLGPAEPPQELTGYTTRDGTDRVLVEPQQPTRAAPAERDTMGPYQTTAYTTRGGEQRVGPAPTEMLPTEMDQPTAEPLADVQAQLSAMDRGERDGVYLPAAQLERYPRLLDDSPATVENFDGKGGAVVFPDVDTAAQYIERRDAGEDMQSILGAITGAGEGKPLSSTAVTLQQLDAEGNVERESLADSPEAAERLQQEWEAELGPQPITTTRVTPLLETTNAPIGEIEEVFGVYADEMNYVEQLDENGKVIARVLAQGAEETAAKVEALESQTEGTQRQFRTLSPQETLLRRERKIADERFPVTDQAEFESRQLDLFDAVPEVVSQARDPKVTKVGPRVRVMDGNIVLWEKVFRAGFEKEAERVAKELEEEIAGVPGLSVWQDKSRKREKKSSTPVMQRGARVATRAKARESYKRVDKTLAEQVQEKLGNELSASEIKEVTEGAKDLDTVADRLIEKGRQAEEIDQRNRIAGMFNPDKLTFKSEQAEESYRAIWDRAVDAQTRIEVKQALGGSDVAGVIRQAKADLKTAQRDMTDLRNRFGQGAWKKTPSKYLKQAQAVSPKRTRQVIAKSQKADTTKLTREEKDVQEILAATRQQQAQREISLAEEAYGDTEYDQGAVAASLEGLREINEAGATAEQQTADELSLMSEQLYFDSSMTSAYVKRLVDEGRMTNEELIQLYEEAMLYRAALNKGKGKAQVQRDLDLTAQIDKARRGEIYQSEMIKDIGRAANQARTQEEKFAASRAPSLVLPTKKGRTKKGRSTTALTAPQYEEESREAKQKRLDEYRERSSRIKKNAETVVSRVENFDVDSIAVDEKQMPTTKGVKQLLALEYLKQLAAMSDAIINTGRKDPGLMKLIRQVDEALARAAKFKDSDLDGFWFNIAKDQNNLAANLRKVDYAERGKLREREVKTLDGESIGGTFSSKQAAEKHRAEVLAKTGASMRGVVEGKTVRFYRQSRMIDEENRAQYFEYVDRWSSDEDFNTFVWPLLQKMIAAQWSADGFYALSYDEVQTLQWLLQRWSSTPGMNEVFGKPLRKMLRKVGLVPFNRKGEIIEEYRNDGRLQHKLPESFDTRERHQRTAREVTEKMQKPERAPLKELRRPAKDLFGNRVPWNKKLPYQQDEVVEPPPVEEAPVGRPRKGPLFSKANIAAVAEYNEVMEGRNAPDDVKALQVFRRFRKIVDNSKSTRDALITAEEKMLESMKALGMVASYANFKGTVNIQLPNGQQFTYRRVASDLGNARITKDSARKRMRSVTKRMTMGTAAQNRWLADNDVAVENYGLAMFDDSYTYTYQLDNYGAGPVTREANATAELLGDLLMYSTSPPNINEMLDIIDANAKGPFAVAANKMKKAWLKDVKVQWDKAGGTNLGRYDPATRTIYLNEDVLIDMRNNADASLSSKVVHTVLHEAAHAATVHALRTRPGVRKSIDVMRGLMRNKWTPEVYGERFGQDSERYAQAIYGLKNAEEFVAEMYSNRDFQRMAAETQLKEMGTNVFERFKSLVKTIFGFEGRLESNVFDMVMEMTDELFSGSGQITAGGSVNLNLADTWAGKAAAQGWDRLDSSLGIEERVRDGLLNRGESAAKWVDRLTSMSQLARRFGDRLPGLTRYVETFKARNARNAELMQVPEKLSREWTTLQENDPEMALEMSKVMTESSLYGVDPTQSLSHPRNSQVKSKTQNQRYYDLAPRYRALSPEAKAIWRKTSEYYATALKRETGLLLLNALRGVVRMDKAEFDKKYNGENILRFDTKEKLKEEFGDSVASVDLGTVLRLASLPELKSGVYFPLTRYGDYAVEASREIKSKTFTSKADASEWASKYKVEDPTLRVEVYREGGRWYGKVMEREFSLHESASQARAKKAELEEIYGTGNVFLSRKYEKYTDAAIQSNKALSSVLDTLKDNPAAQAAIKNFYLRNLADTSFRKREINRKQVKGVDPASQHRNFANYAKQASYYTAQLQYGAKMADALSEMEQAKRRISDDKEALRISRVVESVRERDNMSMDLVVINPAIRTLLGATQFWMLTSASYHMINSSQPWMVTLPIMSSKHGVGKTFAAMKVAQKKVIGTVAGEAKDSLFGLKALTSRAAAEKAFGVFEQLKENLKGDPRANEYIAMLENLRQNHILEVSPMTELREIAAGADQSIGAKALDASRIMAHLVEINNRVLTAVAAYDLAYAEAKAEGLSHDAAMQRGRDYAADMVETTQFDYSTANKPPLFQKLPFMFQFMQWTQHIYALMIMNMHRAVKGGAIERREARKALMGLFGTHAMVGGALGITLQPVKMALGLVALLFADDDDPITAASALSGEWYDRIVTDGLASVFGSDLAMIASRGLPMALGTDLSTRMSLGTLYFVDLRSEDPQQLIGSLVMSFGGAPLSQVMQWGQGATKIADGEYQKGIEQIMPKLFRDMLRTGRYATEGLVNRAGDTVIRTDDMSPWQLGLQFLGFAPEQVSKFYAGQQSMKSVENFVRQRKAELTKAYRTATTVSERMKVREEIRKFNARYRYDPIKGSALQSTMKGKKQREKGYERYGAALDPKKARQYEEYGKPYR